MKDVYPNGEITRIEDDYAIIRFRDGVSVVEVSKLPKGAKVGDRVTVTLQTTVEKVEFWSPD